MTMTVSIRLNEADSQLFKSYAEAHGLTMTDLIRESVLERIETEHDIAELREILAEPNRKRYTHAEVKAELGL